MHIADVDKGMLGANGIDTLAEAIGHITTVSTGYGAVTIAGQSQPNIGDVTADIGGSATTGAVTGNVSKAIASLGKNLVPQERGNRPGRRRWHWRPLRCCPQ